MNSQANNCRFNKKTSTTYLFSLVAVLLATLLCFHTVEVNAGLFDFKCTSSLDCSLNGECVNEKCVCDPAWSGSEQCDVLAIEPIDKNKMGSQYGTAYTNGTSSSWGGNAIFIDGKWHLFAAQILDCTLARWGSNSEIIRAESDSPNGPFEYKETVITPFAHNPTIRQTPDGSFLLYMIGAGFNPNPPYNCHNHTEGVLSSDRKLRMEAFLPKPIVDGVAQNFTGGIFVARSNSVYGPWSKPEVVAFANETDLLHGGYTNPSPHPLPDGSVLLAFQAGQTNHRWELLGVSKADSWNGLYKYLTVTPVTPEKWYCVAGQEEDPFMWQSPRGYHMITHGMCPTGVMQAHYKFSLDGKTWTTSPRQTYSYSVKYTDGTSHLFARVERPQLAFEIFNKTTGTYSNPLTLYNGVCVGLACILTCSDTTCQTYTLARPLKTN